MRINQCTEMSLSKKSMCTVSKNLVKINKLNKKRVFSYFILYHISLFLDNMGLKELIYNIYIKKTQKKQQKKNKNRKKKTQGEDWT